MNVQLISGQFKTSDALDILTQMIQVKIKYHESKISKNTNEEDIKYSESKIKKLQNELHELRKSLAATDGTISVEAVAAIQ